MPTTEGHVTDQPLPSFLSADKTEPQSAEMVWEASVISSRALKIGILAATLAVIGIVTFEMRHSVTRFLKFTDSFIDVSAWQRGSTQSGPPVQATAEVQAVQSSADAAAFAPARDDIAATAAAAAPAGRTRAGNETDEQTSEALFMQFRAWSAKQDARAQVDQTQPELDATAPIFVDAPPGTPGQKPRKPKLAANGRPEATPHIPLPRARIQWGQNARVEGRAAHAQDARAQDPSMQQTPSFLQSLLHQ